jgi:hypothetical protein
MYRHDDCMQVLKGNYTTHHMGMCVQHVCMPCSNTSTLHGWWCLTLTCAVCCARLKPSQQVYFEAGSHTQFDDFLALLPDDPAERAQILREELLGLDAALQTLGEDNRIIRATPFGVPVTFVWSGAFENDSNCAPNGYLTRNGTKVVQGEGGASTDPSAAAAAGTKTEPAPTAGTLSSGVRGAISSFCAMLRAAGITTVRIGVCNDTDHAGELWGTVGCPCCVNHQCTAIRHCSCPCCLSIFHYSTDRTIQLQHRQKHMYACTYRQ